MFSRVKNFLKKSPRKVIAIAVAAAIAATTVGVIAQAEQVLDAGSEVVQIAGGVDSSLLLKSDGSVWASGRNNNGQLGDGTTTNSSSWEEVIDSGITQIAAAGGESAYALKSDGTVLGTGYNGFGQLGDGTTTNKTSWETLSNLGSNVTQIVAGNENAYALKADGSVYGTGYNSYGELGAGNTTEVNTWKKVISSGSNITQIAAGADDAYALKSDGSVLAAGYNGYGEFANGTTTKSTSWEQVISSGSEITQLSASTGAIYALKSDGSVWASGRNNDGQLGDGTTTNKTSLEEVISSDNDITKIASGVLASYALKSDGSVIAAGENTYGELGDGTTTNSASWEQVISSDNDITNIFTGARFAFALKSDGSVLATGQDFYGQLGDGKTGVEYSWIDSGSTSSSTSSDDSGSSDSSSMASSSSSSGSSSESSSASSDSSSASSSESSSSNEASSSESGSSSSSGSTVSSSTVDGETTITGSISGTLLDVSFPSNITYAVDGNGNFTAEELDITNNSQGSVNVAVESLKSESGGTLQFTDVAPDAEDWDSLSLADSKKYIALGISPDTATSWTSPTSDTFWSADSTAITEGTLATGKTGSLQLSCKHGPSFDQDYTALHKLVLEFSLA